MSEEKPFDIVPFLFAMTDDLLRDSAFDMASALKAALAANERGELEDDESDIEPV